jgi:hypothetical protein
MLCQKCGSDNRKNAKLCQSCGQQISPPKTSKSKGQLKRIGLVAAVIMIIAVAVLIPAFIKIRKMACRMVCGTNLAGLSKVMMTYTYDYDTYPSADKWCDLLVEKCDVSRENFCCTDSNVKVGLSRYVFNINAAGKKPSELPPDMVLIFETDKDGWNMAGGKELLSKKNHRGYGCNVVFAGDRTKFIIDTNSLRWTAE